MKIVLIAFTCMLFTGCVVVQKTPKTAAHVVDSQNHVPIAAAIVSGKYHQSDGFREIGKTDADGRIYVPATYHLMPIPHTKLPVRMILRIDAEGYRSVELDIQGIKQDVKIELRHAEGMDSVTVTD